ncbi:hypothetical protein CFOL_v3_32445, partial [Cephalotus follicularis]
KDKNQISCSSPNTTKKIVAQTQNPKPKYEPFPFYTLFIVPSHFLLMEQPSLSLFHFSSSLHRLSLSSHSNPHWFSFSLLHSHFYHVYQSHPFPSLPLSQLDLQYPVKKSIQA